MCRVAPTRCACTTEVHRVLHRRRPSILVGGSGAFRREGLLTQACREQVRGQLRLGPIPVFIDLFHPRHRAPGGTYCRAAISARRPGVLALFGAATIKHRNHSNRQARTRLPSRPKSTISARAPRNSGPNSKNRRSLDLNRAFSRPERPAYGEIRCDNRFDAA